MVNAVKITFSSQWLIARNIISIRNELLFILAAYFILNFFFFLTFTKLYTNNRYTIFVSNIQKKKKRRRLIFLSPTTINNKIINSYVKSYSIFIRKISIKSLTILPSLFHSN